MRLNCELEAPLPQPQINTIISKLFNHKRRSSSGQTPRFAAPAAAGVELG